MIVADESVACGAATIAHPSGELQVQKAMHAADRIDFAMTFPENYGSWIDVKWRAVGGSGRRVLSENATRCTHMSSWTIEAWLAETTYPRPEVERVLAAVGE